MPGRQQAVDAPELRPAELVDGRAAQNPGGDDAVSEVGEGKLPRGLPSGQAGSDGAERGPVPGHVLIGQPGREGDAGDDENPRVVGLLSGDAVDHGAVGDPPPHRLRRCGPDVSRVQLDRAADVVQAGGSGQRYSRRQCGAEVDVPGERADHLVPGDADGDLSLRAVGQHGGLGHGAERRRGRRVGHRQAPAVVAHGGHHVGGAVEGEVIGLSPARPRHDERDVGSGVDDGAAGGRPHEVVVTADGAGPDHREAPWFARVMSAGPPSLSPRASRSAAGACTQECRQL